MQAMTVSAALERAVAAHTNQEAGYEQEQRLRGIIENQQRKLNLQSAKGPAAALPRLRRVTVPPAPASEAPPIRPMQEVVESGSTLGPRVESTPVLGARVESTPVLGFRDVKPVLSARDSRFPVSVARVPLQDYPGHRPFASPLRHMPLPAWASAAGNPLDSMPAGQPWDEDQRPLPHGTTLASPRPSVPWPSIPAPAWGCTSLPLGWAPGSPLASPGRGAYRPVLLQAGPSVEKSVPESPCLQTRVLKATSVGCQADCCVAAACVRARDQSGALGEAEARVA